LFIAHQDIPPGQKAKKLPIAPQIAPIVLFNFASFNDQFRRAGHGQGRKKVRTTIAGGAGFHPDAWAAPRKNAYLVNPRPSRDDKESGRERGRKV
jgi:hypothetical protein